MAIGTFVSRGTGFLRTIIIAAAIGRVVGDAYNTANTLPNSVYDLLMGGILGAVVVPLLVSAARRDPDGGEAYAERLYSLVFLVLGAATLVAFLLAPRIVGLYIGSGHVGVRATLAVTFARFFLPQLFFYGLGAVFGAILNVRGSFAPPMWAPVLNNLVVIVTGLLFILVTRTALVEQGHLSHAQTYLLATGTTLGIVAQTIALLPALRARRFRLRLRLDLRGVGLTRAVGLAGWVFVYVAVNQLAYLLIVRLAYASRYAGTLTVYTYAYTLVLLPYAVVAVSVITALLPQMSRAGDEGRLDGVAADLAGGLKVSAVVLVPAALGGIALGPLAGVVLFAHRTLSVSTGGLIGATLAAFAVGLVPFSAFQLQLRAFYALKDTRTPALVNIPLSAVNVVAAAGFFLVLPPAERSVGLALGYSLSYVIGYAWFGVLLRRRLGAVPGGHLTRTFVRLATAGALAAFTAYVLAHAVTAVVGTGVAGAAAGLVLGVGAGTLAYVWLVSRMRVPEVRQLATLATGPLGAVRRR
jgi:putative peptidoglycan lipid II flippase